MHSFPRAFWLCVAVAVVLRVGYVSGYPQLPPCKDCALYQEVARNLIAGRGFTGGFAAEGFDRDAVRRSDAAEIGAGPVYPAFLAAIYGMGGGDGAVRFAQALVSALTLVPLFAVTSAAFGPRIGVTASLIAAVYPPLIVYTGFLLTETVTTALLVCAIWAVARGWLRSTATAWALAGLLSGVAILARGELLLLPLVVAAVMIVARPDRRTAAQLAVFGMAVAAAMAPWVIRNYRLVHRVIPVAARDGDTLWISARGWQVWQLNDPELGALVRGRDFLAQEDAMRDAAVARIVSDPSAFFATRLARFPDFVLTSHTSNVAGVTESFATYRARGDALAVAIKATLLAVNTVLIVVGLAGIAVVLARSGPAAPLAGFVAAPVAIIVLVHFVLYATGRYQIPMLPFIIAFAAALARPRGTAQLEMQAA